MAKTMFEKIKGWYPKLWNETMVRNAVKKGIITKDEFKEITGIDYNTPNKVKEETSAVEVSSNKE